MNKVSLKSQSTPIDADFALWNAEQGALLCEGRLDRLDRENLAEEIESFGRSERREIRLELLVLHLLKWQYQPGWRSQSWRISISEQRVAIDEVIRTSPSLKRYPEETFRQAYERGRQRAVDETGMLESAYPYDPPFSVAQALDSRFLPSEPFAPSDAIRD